MPMFYSKIVLTYVKKINELLIAADLFKIF